MPVTATAKLAQAHLSACHALKTYADLLTHARTLKIAANEAAILICHRLGISRASLIAFAERTVNAELAAEIQHDLAARARGVSWGLPARCRWYTT